MEMATTASCLSGSFPKAKGTAQAAYIYMKSAASVSNSWLAEWSF